jgi:hypothetical protein
MPMVVEATLEEQVSNIKEVIKGFHTRIKDLESCTTPGTPPEEKEERERTTMTTVASIKRLEEECTKLCEESTQIWKNMMEDPEMKVVEARLRDAQEKAQKASENISTLPPVERMMTILAQRKSYNEIEKIRDQQKILQQ